MRQFGKRGVPVLRKALKDRDDQVRVAALFAIERLGADAADLEPELRSAQQNDSVAYCRQLAASALRRIDAGHVPAQQKNK
jgi:HEAT repeat protein